MERKIVRTADGSRTLQLPAWKEPYHSLHGALQEAYHVFIRSGLDQFQSRELSLLEMGFGTGLNALITLLEAPGRDLTIRYTALEAFPVVESEWEALGYGQLFGEREKASRFFRQLHQAPWEESRLLTPDFELRKRRMDFLDFESEPIFDLIYFDAFGARVQPELWTEAVFRSMYTALHPGGLLVTYAAKGSVRRAMQAVGFQVERLPGPPGKREMLRARKVL